MCGAPCWLPAIAIVWLLTVFPVQINKRTGLPAVTLYTDKDTGKNKGDATLSYEEPPAAKAAVEWFDGQWQGWGTGHRVGVWRGAPRCLCDDMPSLSGKDFQGKKLKVSMARRKPIMGMMRGGMPMRDGRGMMGRGGM